jgi:hypothetical protein
MKSIITHGTGAGEGVTTRVEEYDDAAISVGEDGDLLVLSTEDQTVIDTFEPGQWSNAEVMP